MEPGPVTEFEDWRDVAKSVYANSKRGIVMYRSAKASIFSANVSFIICLLMASGIWGGVKGFFARTDLSRRTAFCNSGSHSGAGADRLSISAPGGKGQDG